MRKNQQGKSSRDGSRTGNGKKGSERGKSPVPGKGKRSYGDKEGKSSFSSGKPFAKKAAFGKSGEDRTKKETGRNTRAGKGAYGSPDKQRTGRENTDRFRENKRGGEGRAGRENTKFRENKRGEEGRTGRENTDRFRESKRGEEGRTGRENTKFRENRGGEEKKDFWSRFGQTDNNEKPSRTGKKEFGKSGGEREWGKERRKEGTPFIKKSSAKDKDKEGPELKRTRKYKEKDEKIIGNWRKEVPASLGTPEKPAGNPMPNSLQGKEEIRLNKYISNSGLCSRREADEFITGGFITVNGEPVTELGQRISRTDEVRYKGRLLVPENLVHILMNKPKDCITTVDDPEGRRTIMEFLPDDITERLFPIGRLDRNTTGVILLTNDGDLSQKLTHPSFGVHKVYKAELDKPMSKTDFELLAEGVELEDGFIRPDELAYLDESRSVLGVEIHSGKNHIIHRMFNHLGYLVDKLDRVSFAGLTKDGLKKGEFRYLSEKEVNKLRKASGAMKS
jgi:23S rRNA pseudouridine2605 synthase